MLLKAHTLQCYWFQSARAELKARNSYFGAPTFVVTRFAMYPGTKLRIGKQPVDVCFDPICILVPLGIVVGALSTFWRAHPGRALNIRRDAT